MKFYHIHVTALTILLTACAGMHSTKTQEQFYSDKCEEMGFGNGSQEHALCVQERIAEIDHKIAATNQKWHEDQLAADGKKCRDYGFKKGTKDFASCVMQIEQARKQEKLLHQQNTQNYLLQQQAIRAQQNMLRNTRNTDCYKLGNSVHCTSSSY